MFIVKSKKSAMTYFILKNKINLIRHQIYKGYNYVHITISGRNDEVTLGFDDANYEAFIGGLSSDYSGSINVSAL